MNETSGNSSRLDEEISLTELLAEFWRLRFTIIFIIFGSVLAGVLYSKIAPAQFSLKAKFEPFFYNHAISNEILKAYVLNITEIISEEAESYKVSDVNFQKNNGMLTIVGDSEEVVKKAFDLLSQRIQLEIYNNLTENIEMSVAVIEKVRQKVTPDVYSESLIWNEMVLASMDKYQGVGTFVEANVVQIKPQPLIITALSTLLGLLLAFVYVLTQLSITKRN